eukprot:g1576.t1
MWDTGGVYSVSDVCSGYPRGQVHEDFTEVAKFADSTAIGDVVKRAFLLHFGKPVTLCDVGGKPIAKMINGYAQGGTLDALVFQLGMKQRLERAAATALGERCEKTANNPQAIPGSYIDDTGIAAKSIRAKMRLPRQCAMAGCKAWEPQGPRTPRWGKGSWRHWAARCSSTCRCAGDNCVCCGERGPQAGGLGLQAGGPPLAVGGGLGLQACGAGVHSGEPRGVHPQWVSPPRAGGGVLPARSWERTARRIQVGIFPLGENRPMGTGWTQNR